jgi:hypothetical protein
MQTKGQLSKPEVDEVLLPFVQALDSNEEEFELGWLISIHASPVIKNVLKSKLHVPLNSTDGSFENQEALEIEGDIRTRLLEELRELKSSNEKQIKSFQGFVAVLAFHACSEYLRKKYPQRWRLKDKLRYLLLNNPTLALWETEKGWFCGLAEWKGTETSVEIRELPEGTLPAISPSSSPAQQLTEIFRTLRAPVAFHDMINLMTSLWEVREQVRQADTEGDELSAIRDTRVDIARETEQKILLERLWSEICELPVRQRTALLLNLRDPNGTRIIDLFVDTRIASMRQIASVLEMAAEDLAAIWNSLPLTDLQIAELLGIKRQQVINLRLAARERLARRMKSMERK